MNGTKVGCQKMGSFAIWQKEILRNIFSYSTQGRLRDSQVRGDVGQGNPVDQTGKFLYKIKVAIGSILAKPIRFSE